MLSNGYRRITIVSDFSFSEEGSSQELAYSFSEPRGLEITDQHGNPIKLPDEESEALALAMALHEKGRKALKDKEYGQALLYLLEADKEFE